MLDVLTGGRLLAGFPVGTPMDGTLCYGLPPLEQRERYYEAHDLIIKAWTDDGAVRVERQVLPAPVRQHVAQADPATAPAGLGARHRERQHLGLLRQVRLRLHGAHRVQRAHRASPTRSGSSTGSGTASRPTVTTTTRSAPASRSDPGGRRVDGADRARLRRPAIDYFFNGSIHIAPEHLNPPGYADYGSLLRAFQMQAGAKNLDQTGGGLDMFRFDGWTFKDYVDKQIIVAGTADEVAEQIEEYVRRMHSGPPDGAHAVRARCRRVSRCRTSRPSPRACCRASARSGRASTRTSGGRNGWPVRTRRSPRRSERGRARVPARRGGCMRWSTSPIAS